MQIRLMLLIGNDEQISGPGKENPSRRLSKAKD